MTSTEKVTVVTGGNRGIGLALVRNLCRNFDGIVYLTCRNEARGQMAVDSLKSEGLTPRYHQLDIDSKSSIATFADKMRSAHGGIDVLISNGSTSYEKGSTVPLAEQAENMIRINNKGNAVLAEALLPLMRQDGRYVIVSSGFGQLKSVSAKVRPKFNTESMSVDELDDVLNEYVASVKDGDFKEKGWPEWCNIISKLGLVALTRILARELKDNPRRLLINAACPGWTVTDATKTYLDENDVFGDVKAKQPDEAAVDVVWLATLPPGTTFPNGMLVQYKNVLPYDE